jgi:hypothetical protein
MIAFMISSSKLTVVAVGQYLHDLIIIIIFFFFFFFLPPLKQAKLVLVMEMRLFTQNPIITTTCGAQQNCFIAQNVGPSGWWYVMW